MPVALGVARPERSTLPRAGGPLRPTSRAGGGHAGAVDAASVGVRLSPSGRALAPGRPGSCGPCLSVASSARSDVTAALACFSPPALLLRATHRGRLLRRRPKSGRRSPTSTPTALRDGAPRTQRPASVARQPAGLPVGRRPWEVSFSCLMARGRCVQRASLAVRSALDRDDLPLPRRQTPKGCRRRGSSGREPRTSTSGSPRRFLACARPVQRSPRAGVGPVVRRCRAARSARLRCRWLTSTLHRVRTVPARPRRRHADPKVGRRCGGRRQHAMGCRALLGRCRRARVRHRCSGRREASLSPPTRTPDGPCARPAGLRVAPRARRMPESGPHRFALCSASASAPYARRLAGLPRRR